VLHAFFDRYSVRAPRRQCGQGAIGGASVAHRRLPSCLRGDRAACWITRALEHDGGRLSSLPTGLLNRTVVAGRRFDDVPNQLGSLAATFLLVLTRTPCAPSPRPLHDSTRGFGAVHSVIDGTN